MMTMDPRRVKRRWRRRRKIIPQNSRSSNELDRLPPYPHDIVLEVIHTIRMMVPTRGKKTLSLSSGGFFFFFLRSGEK